MMTLADSHYTPGHPALSSAFFNWFYLDNPAGAATFVVALEDDIWVGVIVLIPVLLQVSGRVQPAAFAVNVLIHPQHRGKHLFTKMIRAGQGHLMDSGTWLLGHPNSNALAGWKRTKMEFRTSLSLYIGKWWPFPLRHRLRTIKDVDELDAIDSKLWDTVNSTSGARVRLCPKFIAWRYLNAPHRKYSVRAVESSGGVVGLQVLRRFKGPFDLLVDYIGDKCSAPVGALSSWRPTLFMHAGDGADGLGVGRLGWKWPRERKFPFFVTTWGNDMNLDMSGISLAASDF
jgi:hypothetical protein